MIEVAAAGGVGLLAFLWTILATCVAIVAAAIAFWKWVDERRAHELLDEERELLREHRVELDRSRAAESKAANERVEQVRRDANAEIEAARQAVANAFPEARAKAAAALRDERRELKERTDAAVLEERERGERLRQMRDELKAIEDRLAMHEIGLYRPSYAFDEPTAYTLALDDARAKQAAMVRDGEAVRSDMSWTVNGSAKQGKLMVEREAKLMLRAFNGECDALLVKVRADNADKLIDRMTKARAAINKLGGERNAITDAYLLLKVAELRLVYEREQKLQLMREIERQQRDRIRDEQLALKEIERAQAEALKDEERYAKALERARAEADAAGASAKQALLDKIADLDAKLIEAQARTERAKSRAQMTRSGHVYVISNEGAFGAGIYKIGMTRRLEPHDRVRELGDASVPFTFDVHAMIFTEDAPGLETALHRVFAERRVNLVNLKREFFRVTLLEIETAAREHHPDVEFVHIANADEWRQSEAIRSGYAAMLTIDADEPPDPLDGLD